MINNGDGTYAEGGSVMLPVYPHADYVFRIDDAAAEGDPLAGIDESRMEAAINTLSGEMGALEDENTDPVAAARLFQKFAHLTGMKFKPELREALARLEAGADPDTVESEFSEVLNDDNPFAAPDTPFETLWRQGVPLTLMLNSLNRSLGHQDAYPFALSPGAIAKLNFIHSVIGAHRRQWAASTLTATAAPPTARTRHRQVSRTRRAAQSPKFAAPHTCR